jgi:hypothetical protein
LRRGIVEHAVEELDRASGSPRMVVRAPRLSRNIASNTG